MERHFCNLCSETLDSIAAAHVAIQINKILYNYLNIIMNEK
jgi:hypothetical protein